MATRGKAEYYKMRLDHTIKHTQEMTGLVYLVNAGILAFMAFLWGKENDGVRIVAPVLTLIALGLLAYINHQLFLFIKRQSLHYRDLRRSYWGILEPDEKNDEENKKTESQYSHYFSTDLIANIHLGVFLTIIIVLIVLAIFFMSPILCAFLCFGK